MAPHKCLCSGNSNSYSKMCSVHNNTYLLCFMLILQLGESKLSLNLHSLDGNKMKKLTTNGQEEFYTYDYSMTNGSVVYIECTDDSPKSKSTLNWQITIPVPDKPPNLTRCNKQNVQELNYITKLNSQHHKNNLTCIRNSMTEIATATVTFRCLSCKGVENNTFSAGCYNSFDGVHTYINGQHSINGERTEVIKDDIYTVHCQIDVDDKYKLKDNLKTFKDLIYGPSIIKKHVIAFQVNVTNMLDSKTISCEKETTGGAPIKKSLIIFTQPQVYIDIIRTGSINQPSRIYNDSELLYSDNDTIKLNCTWKMDVAGRTQWLKDGNEETTDDSNKNIFKATLTPQDNKSNLTCQWTMTDSKKEVTHRKTIFLRYESSKRPNSENFDITISNLNIEPERYLQNAEWIGIGIAIVILVVVIIYIAIEYKSRSGATRDVTPHTESEAPVLLEPTYAGPIDDANMYAYTYNQKPVQDTYSTPFVPTIEEMYTKPTPTRRKQTDSEYQLPSKITYANLQSCRENLRPSDHDSTSANTGDGGSETYTYCSPGYSRP